MLNQAAVDSVLPELADLPSVLTLPQVATILQVSNATAYNLAASGELKALRFGGSVRVLKSDLAAMILGQSPAGDARGGS